MPLKNFDSPIPPMPGVRHGGGYKQIIETFVGSGRRTAEVELEAQADATGVVSGLRQALKRHRDLAAQVAVKRRGDRVFLERRGT